MAGYASGHLIFVRDGALMAQAFDPDRTELKRDPFRLVENVHSDPYFGDRAAPFSVSQNGALAYRNDVALPDRILWVGRDGKEIGPALPPGDITEPVLSPDGTKLAFAQDGAIWVQDLKGGAPIRFTFDPADIPASVWSPEGDALAFYSGRAGGPGLYRRNLSGIEELILPSRMMLSAYESSKEGLTFFGRYPETAAVDQGNFLLKPGEPKPQQLFNTSGFDADASVSPDGKWLAYASTETGRFEVYVTTLAPSATKKAVTNGGGVDAKWSRNGKEVFYVHSVTGELMSVEVKTENGLDIGARRRIHPGPLKWGSLHSFAEAPDGNRFLVWTFDPNRGDITVLLNWPSLLKK